MKNLHSSTQLFKLIIRDLVVACRGTCRARSYGIELICKEGTEGKKAQKKAKRGERKVHYGASLRR